MTTTHDAGYKKLFSHPRLVADFLRGFVPEDWVQQLDFDTLERLGSNYVSMIGLRHSPLASLPAGKPALSGPNQLTNLPFIQRAIPAKLEPDNTQQKPLAQPSPNDKTHPS